MSLSRDRIAAAALALGAAEGLEALTMRRVAAALGVEAMSLYRHVADKADLLDAVHDALLAEVPSPGDGPWDQELVRVAAAFREAALARPRLAPLLARPGTTPHGQRLIAAGVGALARAGFSDEDAVVAFQTVFAFVVGHALFHAGLAAPEPAWAGEEFRRGLAVIVAGLRATAPAGGPPG